MRGTHERVPAAVLSPDGKLIAHTTPAREVLVWSVEPRRPLFTLTLEAQPLPPAFMPDGLWLAIGTEIGSADLYSMELSKQIGMSVAKEASAITALVFETSGKNLAVGTRSGAVALWNLESKTRSALAPVHEDAVTGLSFNDKGDQLASAGKDRRVWQWNLSEPDAVPVPLGPTNSSVSTEEPFRVAFARRM